MSKVTGLLGLIGQKQNAAKIANAIQTILIADIRLTHLNDDRLSVSFYNFHKPYFLASRLKPLISLAMPITFLLCTTALKWNKWHW